MLSRKCRQYRKLTNISEMNQQRNIFTLLLNALLVSRLLPLLKHTTLCRHSNSPFFTSFHHCITMHSSPLHPHRPTAEDECPSKKACVDDRKYLLTSTVFR